MDTKCWNTAEWMHCTLLPSMGTENGVELTISNREAAKEYGVDFVLIVSTVTSDLTNTLFAKPFTELESKLSNLEEATVYIPPSLIVH